MRILRDETAIAALPEIALRRLIEQRVAEINESCPWEADELGYFIVIEPGDTAGLLAAEMGFSVLRNLCDDTPFGHPGFNPAFEYAAVHTEGYFELVYVVSDGGFAYTVFIPDQTGVDPELLSFCRAYAVQVV